MLEKDQKNIISSVAPGSIGEELELEVGDTLLAINGKKINDIIDYLYLLSDDYLEIEIEKKNGENWVLEIEKEFDEDLGVEFDNPILDKARSCKNKCVLCFVDQLPEDMRQTLYFKDDDSRLSFLQGNFVTLTNLSDKDIDRIVEYNISPINVSIHTTNPELRVKMLKNKSAGNVLERLKQLTESRIIVNGQIVLCPGYNDGKELEKTINDLYKLHPNLESLAIVPVGLTKYREGLEDLQLFDKNSSRVAIEQVRDIQNRLLNEIGTRFVYLSDEFYINANMGLPTYEEYEGFPQLENGVGLIRKLEQEFYDYLETIEPNTLDRRLVIATGVSAQNHLRKFAGDLMQKFEGLEIDVRAIDNNFFGKSITVAGLITGSDIMNQIKEHVSSKDILLIPKSMLKANEEVLLDDTTVDEMRRKLGCEVRITDVNGSALINNIIK